MKEKREYIRFDSNALVKYIIQKPDSPQNNQNEIHDIVKNLSIQGVCVILNQQLASSTVILLEIFLPSIPKSINLEGEVCWSRPFMNQDINNMFETGVKILNISKNDRNRFINYLETKS
ncbi:MAG: PilZ domain-containing protein [bacterium]